jgi:hypothetical protein
MTVPGAGFITSFDTTTIVNHTTQRGVGFANVNYTVNGRTYVLPNGTKANYDGTSDSVITPDSASQLFYVTTGAGAVLDALAAKTGFYGTLVHDDESWNAIMKQPKRVGPGDLSATATMIILVEFELVSEF